MGKTDLNAGYPIAGCRLIDKRLLFDGREVHLEPKVVQVLLLLAKNVEQLVTRDQLIEVVWRGRPVTDDALTRCISRLRRALGDELDAPLRIETVAKSGYRLHIDEPTSVSSMPLLYRYRYLVGALVCAFLLPLFVLLLPHDKTQEQYARRAWQVSEQWERYPEFSPDGDLITYSQGSRDGLAIMLRQYGGEGFQQLTSGEYYDHQPSFSPKGDRIAFARVHHDRCDLVVIPVIGGDENTLAPCGRRGVLDLQWTPDGHSVLIITRDRPMQAGRLHLINVDTGVLRDVTPAHGMGVDDFALSSRGEIALSVQFALGVEDIYLSNDLEKESWRRLTHDQVKIHGLAWSAEANSLFFTSNRGGPFQLWRHTLSQQSPALVSEALTGGDAIAVHPRGHLALSRWREASEIIEIAIDSDQERELVAAKAVNWDARVAPGEGDFVYVSNRSGAAELWLRKRLPKEMRWENTDRQLTHFRGPWVMTPRWSPDARAIAFMVPLAGEFKIHIFDMTRGKLRDDLGELAGFAPHWSPDGEALYFGSRRSGEWQIWRKDLLTLQLAQVTKTGAKVAKISPDGKTLFVIKPDRAGIWQYPLNREGGERLVVRDLAPVDWNNWQVVDDAIYYVQRPESGSAVLRRHTLSTQHNVVLRPLSELLYFSGISIDETARTLSFARLTSEDADIDLLVRKATP